MEKVQAYLDSPAGRGAALKLFEEVGIRTLLDLSKDPERYPLVVEALERVFIDPDLLLHVFSDLQIAGIRSYLSYSSPRQILFRGISRISPESFLKEVDRGEEMLEVLLECLAVGETAIVEPVTAWVLKLGKTEAGGHWLGSRKFVEGMETGCRHQDDTVRVRFLDLLIQSGNLSPVLFETYRSAGLINLALSTYSTPDLLLKLAVIDVILLFGNAPHSVRFLTDSELMNVLAQELSVRTR